MGFTFLTVRYNSNDNLAVHSSDIHFKVSEAGFKQVSKTRCLTARGIDSAGRGAHGGSCRTDDPGRWRASYTRQHRGHGGAERQPCGQTEAPKCIQVT